MVYRRLLPLFFLLSPLACDGDAMDAESSGDATGDSGDTPTVDEQAIAEQAINFQSLTKINDQPQTSQHGLADTMNLWVDAAAAEDYAGLSLGGTPTFEPQTILLKEQLNADATLNSVAVMYKGPSGYSTSTGDWWFGLVNPDGTVRLGGQPASCVDCHAAVETQDWAWGLPE